LGLRTPDAYRKALRDGRRVFYRGRWIEDVTGTSCAMFCPPMGKFRREHLAMARECGFAGIRTVELLSIGAPRECDGIVVMPTTIQAYPHGMMSYLKNAARRGAAGNFWRWVRMGRSGDWVRFAQRVLDEVLRCGGVFHLWGHSWEIEENGQWPQVEEAMRILAGAKDRARCVANGDLCRRVTSEE